MAMTLAQAALVIPPEAAPRTALEARIANGERASSLLPSNPSFAGHATFAMRSGWLKKGMDALQTPAVGGNAVFGRKDALVTLGVGKNMVQSIRHWLLTTQMAAEVVTAQGRVLQPSPLGEKLFGAPQANSSAEQPGWDPYLEDDATLWLLHWQLCGPGSQAFTWAWAFNEFREYEFSKEVLVDGLLNAVGRHIAKPVARETAERDVECLLHTYLEASKSGKSEDDLDCPLNTLVLLRPSFSRHFRFAIGPKPSLPLDIFCYALACFWNWKSASARTLSAWDVAYAAGSPGVVFKLDEDSVLEYLDGLSDATNGRLRFEDTPQVRQVVLAQGAEGADLTALAFLQHHYDNQYHYPHHLQHPNDSEHG